MYTIKLKKVDPIFLAIVVVSCIFIFSNLGNIYLWQDEATTAVIARNTLAHGIPYGYSIFTPEETASNPRQIWFYQPWLQFYLVALSFLIFGESTWAARFPFAILGIGTCVLTYFLALRLTKDKLVARISVLSLTFSIPFILHTRQCRYYSLVAFLTVCALLAYYKFIYAKKYSGFLFSIALILLFHANYAVFITIFSAIFIHYAFYLRQAGYSKRFLFRDIFVLLGIFLFTFSFILYIKMLRTDVSLRTWGVGAHSIFGFLKHIKKQLEYYLRTLTKFVVPAVFFGITWLICRLSKKRFLILSVDIDKVFLRLIILVIIVSIVILAVFVDQRHFRYVIFLLPLLYVLEGIFFAGWLKLPKRRIAAIIILIALVSSNVLFRPNELRFRLFDYFYEITHDYDDTTEGIVKFLNANAKEGESVKMPYDHSPIIFYTKGLKVYGRDGMEFIEDETYPDWIIYRRFWVPDEFFNSQYYKNIKARYQEIPLTGYRDLKWGNVPDPGEHRYRTETDKLDEVPIIYKKIK